uniref:Elongation of very long chain fatty acids protein n=1 Tax=Parastrongyloides trichosuri TaxID=131310 RepID=A0A0N4ZRH4_PARTI
MMDIFYSIVNYGLEHTEKLPYSKFKHSYRLPIEYHFDEDLTVEYVSKYWILSVPIAIFYLIGIFQLKSFMNKRKPYKLNHLLTLWNGLLAIFSFIGLYRISEEVFFVTKNEGIYTSICQSFSVGSVSAFWYIFFGLSKFIELGDTILLALKKRHLTFLHCYHHAIVLVYTWQSGSEQIGAGRWFIWMNFLAHSLMYTYFTAMSLNIKWVKKYAFYVTTVQILQMIIGIVISTSTYFIKTFTKHKCQQSYFNLYFCFSIYLSFAILFVRFFVKAYYSKKVKTN